MCGHHSLVADPLPAFRLLEPPHDEQGQEGGNGTDQKHDPPGRTEYRSAPDICGSHACSWATPRPRKMKAARHISDAGKSLQERQRLRPRRAGHDFGHEGHADGKLSPDAQPRQEAVKSEIPRAVREKELSPVQSEYIRTVIIIVFARPMRSPSMPKNSPPVAQPAMKIDVA